MRVIVKSNGIKEQVSKNVLKNALKFQMKELFRDKLFLQSGQLNWEGENIIIIKFSDPRTSMNDLTMTVQMYSGFLVQLHISRSTMTIQLVNLSSVNH